MADLKPKSLPSIGAVLNPNAPIKTTTALSGRVAVVSEWRNLVTWQGFYAYSPYARGINAAPSPGQQFKYGNIVQRRTRPSKTWSTVGVTSWPFRAGGLPGTYWSDRSPQTLYGWIPYKPPTTENGGNNNDATKSVDQNPKDKSKGGSDGAASGTTGGVSLNRNFAGKAVVTNPPLHDMSKAHLAPFEVVNKRDLRLGLIYLPTDFSDPNRNYSKRWGFRFLYNPTFWGYSMSIDESQAAPSQVLNSLSNPSPLPGTATWSLELYLNRVADMKKANQAAKYYSPRVPASELKNLWSRGTEYDLDYLYRTVNGDPKKIANFGFSANIGFLAAQRVGVRLANGAFFYGRITNIDVQHVMMTDMLVPTFSKVNVTISEYIQNYKKK